MSELIKVENVETTGWQGALRGMRNPMESWDKSDTTFDLHRGLDNILSIIPDVGPNDLDLMMRLVKAGSDHRKFIRQIGISMDLSCAWGIWKEYATYKVGTVENSTSQMHKLGSRKLTKDDFAIEDWKYSHDSLLKLINSELTDWQALKNSEAHPDIIKNAWRTMISLVPASFIYKRTCSLNYEVLRNMYGARKNHKQKEWPMILEAVMNQIPHPWIITENN